MSANEGGVSNNTNEMENPDYVVEAIKTEIMENFRFVDDEQQNKNVKELNTETENNNLEQISRYMLKIYNYL